MNTEYTTGIWISSIWVYLHVHFYYRLFIVLGSNLLFIRHHMRSDLPLGLQLLEGRNTLWVPEDAPPHMPRGTTISAWVNFYTPILHQGHLSVIGPGVPMLTRPRDWSDRCLVSLPGMYPHVWIHAGCAHMVGMTHVNVSATCEHPA